LLGSDSSGAVKAGEAFDWTISPTSKLRSVSGLWKVDDSTIRYHFDAGIATSSRRAG
jgi:hypothetical protein